VGDLVLPKIQGEGGKWKLTLRKEVLEANIEELISILIGSVEPFKTFSTRFF